MKMTAVDNRKADIGSSRHAAEGDPWGRLSTRRPQRVGELVESLVRHPKVASRTGPEGQYVDADVGDYSLSPRTLARGGGRPGAAHP